MEEETVRLHIPDMSAELHRSIKVAAAQSGKPLKEWVKDAMREALKRGAE